MGRVSSGSVRARWLLRLAADFLPQLRADSYSYRPVPAAGGPDLRHFTRQLPTRPGQPNGGVRKTKMLRSGHAWFLKLLCLRTTAGDEVSQRDLVPRRKPRLRADVRREPTKMHASLMEHY
jgi:hypothetical protein